jgi:hypothetical protein
MHAMYYVIKLFPFLFYPARYYYQIFLYILYMCPQVQGRSESYGKSYARDFSVRSNLKPGDPAENYSHRHSTPY